LAPSINNSDYTIEEDPESFASENTQTNANINLN
jgi:hypothetical protein